MSEGEVWTVGRLLKWTTDFLAARKSASPRLDAEVLLAHALGCQRIELYTSFDSVPGDAQRSAFRELVRQRADGVPVAYLVGHREFFGLDFCVTRDVLIPRPETELLVVKLLDAAAAVGRTAPRLLDIGAGSGILAICAAKHLPSAEVTAIDLSPAALAVARQNAGRHGVAERINWVQSDLLVSLPAEAAFDFIVSNPPYVSDREYAELPRDVREFEPRMALLSGPQGTEVIARLVPQAAVRLAPGGSLMIEISPMIATAVEAIFQAEPRLEGVEIHKDLARKPRVVTAKAR